MSLSKSVGLGSTPRGGAILFECVGYTPASSRNMTWFDSKVGNVMLYK
jgi:hypothetical protein